MNGSIFSRQAARTALDSLSAGVPPTNEITEFISVGLERDLRIFEEEYFGPDGLLRDPEGAGSFKLVEAYYGGGKTHYLRSVERLAHRNGFASAFVELNKNSCPLTRFDLIYSKVVEALTLPLGKTPIRGLTQALRHWIELPEGSDLDPIVYAQEKIEKMGDLPFPSLTIALKVGARALASKDQHTLDEVLVYLHDGKATPTLRRQGILQTIDIKTGVLAMRSVMIWLRNIGLPGLVLIMDEGDRSLSYSAVKEKFAASNNLVQLINETAVSGDWPGVMFLYSIPSWSAFESSFGTNQALIQRVRETGFPDVPPAPRICLEAKTATSAQKKAFCLQVGQRVAQLFGMAYPNSQLDASIVPLANLVAEESINQTADESYRRIFIKHFIACLYRIKGGEEVSRSLVQQTFAD